MLLVLPLLCLAGDELLDDLWAVDEDELLLRLPADEDEEDERWADELLLLRLAEEDELLLRCAAVDDDEDELALHSGRPLHSSCTNEPLTPLVVSVGPDRSVRSWFLLAMPLFEKTLTGMSLGD